MGIDRLSVQERLLLIEQIWDSLPDQVQPGELPEWHLAELARRRSLSRADSATGKPWREVLSSLENAP
ncbi:MAG TPA: addiction module protein [Pirellulales bacterium]|jgi:putative addiction module component (TIGR02574 family)|nr:addiction module protein [Pirellulales bacterium]